MDSSTGNGAAQTAGRSVQPANASVFDSSAGGGDGAASNGREYHDFVQVLGGTTYILRRDDLPDPVEGLRSPMMREHIARGVETLLLRVRAEGWEPDGPTDPNTLWLNGQVTYERRRGDLFGQKTNFNLSNVRIRCSRPKDWSVLKAEG